MPKELPGLHWDPEKNRYFPVSSRPPGPPAATSQWNPATKGQPQKPQTSSNQRDGKNGTPPVPRETRAGSMKRQKEIKTLLNLTQSMVNSSWNWAEAERTRKFIISSNIAETSRVAHWDVPTFGRTTTFCTFPSKTDDSWTGTRWHLLGDSLGWLFRCNTSQGVVLPDGSSDESGSRTGYSAEQQYGSSASHWLPWSTELNLQPSGHISSISISGSRWVATGSGNAPRVVFSDIRYLDQMCIITMSKVRDIWCSHLHGEELLLGGTSRAVYLQDIDHSPSPKFLHTESDVFSVTQDNHLIYTGSRNGTIHRFDKRVGLNHRGQGLLEGRFHHRNQRAQRSPVLKLDLMANSTFSRTLESGFLVAHMNGALQLFDLRRLSSSISIPAEPVVQYFGHVNSYRKDLGLAVDSENDFVYAAGQDRRIRGWRLSTGEPIEPSSASDTSTTSGSFNGNARRLSNPFLATFDDPVEVLQVSSGSYQAKILTPELAGGEESSLRDIKGVDMTTEGGGSSLWAATGRDLWKWDLGQHGVSR